MSHQTIAQASVDEALQARTEAAGHKEAIANPEFGDTYYGKQIIAGTASIWQRFRWPVAVDTEAAYESAIISGNPDPGGDPSVITDAAISSAIQAHWPQDSV